MVVPQEPNPDSMSIQSASITHWIGQWEQGDERAAHELYERSKEKLDRIIRQLLSSCFLVRFSISDVRQDVLDNVLGGIAEGKFEIANRKKLWGLLRVKATHIVGQYVDRHLAEKRDIKREVSEQELSASLDIFSQRQHFSQAVCQLLEDLEPYFSDERDAEICSLRMKGHSKVEIAELLGCSEWTVRNRLVELEERLERDRDPI